jgi:hypothetical protein
VPRCEITVRGRLPESLIELISTRFDGHLNAGDAGGRDTVLLVEAADPSAERALLTLLWDAGHDVTSMRSTRATPAWPTTGPTTGPG